jgi:hypothetical protein
MAPQSKIVAIPTVPEMWRPRFHTLSPPAQRHAISLLACARHVGVDDFTSTSGGDNANALMREIERAGLIKAEYLGQDDFGDGRYNVTLLV